jgi:probable HAF family extracellular repeat protein
VIISGQNTHFVQGPTTASFGNGITVTAVTVIDATHLSATITIATSALVGSRTVTVTTGSEVVSLANGFTVNPGTNQPPVVSAGPEFSAVLLAPRVINGTVTDDGLPNPPGALTITWSKVSGPGSVNFSNPNAAVTSATFDRLGKYVLRLSASDSSASASADVAVKVGCPVGPYPVGSIAFCDDFERPDGPVGNGWTSWWSSTFDSANIGLAAGELSTHGYPNLAGGVFRTLPVSAPFSFAFDFKPTPTTNQNCGVGAPPGTNEAAWQISINTAPVASSPPFGSNTRAQMWLYQYAASRSLNREYWNGSARVTDSVPGGPEPIPGHRDFAPGVTAHIEGSFNADLSGSITVTYNDGQTPASIVFPFGPVPAPVALPPGSILVFGNATCNTGLYLFDNLDIRAGQTPSINSVTPSSGQQGQSQAVVVTGLNTHFVQGTSAANFGTGTTVNTVSVTDATHLTAQITIDSAATLGTRTVTVTTGAEVVSLTNGFTVTASAPVPTISLVSPNSGEQGQTNLPVTITGQNTHFVQGISQVSFGLGIVANSVTVASATSLTAVINIGANAAAGSRIVTVTSGTEVAVRANGFNVVAVNQPPVVNAGGNQAVTLSLSPFPTTYSVINLGTLGGTRTQALHLNDAGVVVGFSAIPQASGGTFHAFSWQRGVMTDLTPGSGSSFAYKVNSSGQIAGSVQSGSGLSVFLVSGGQLQDLGIPTPSSIEIGMNNRGQVTGTYGQTAGAPGSQAFLYDGATIQRLGTLGGTWSAGAGINDKTEIVGNSERTDGRGVPFIWTKGLMTELPSGGLGGEAIAINNVSQVAGYTPSSSSQALLWNN